jgi:SAM-dependent methyltransferase
MSVLVIMEASVRVFDAFAREYSFWIEHVNPPRYHDLLDAFLPEEIALALDAGCGPGHLARYLAGRAKQVIAIDLSSSMIALAKSRQAPWAQNHISFLVMDLSRAPLEPGTLDFIGSDCVLHETPLDVTLPSLRSLLKPGGRMVIRDLVTARPYRNQSPLWQLLRTARRIPRYVRHFGLRDTLRLVTFEANPAWVRQRCRSERTTPETFRATYSRFLPGCTFVDHGWAMTAFWAEPGDS